MEKFLGQGSTLRHSSNPSCCSDNTRSFTCCATRELPLSFYSFEVSHPSESSVPSHSPSPLNLSNQVHCTTRLDSSPKCPQLTLSLSIQAPVLAPYLAGQVCHAVAATHAGCRRHSSGWAWGSTLPPPVLPRGSPRIQTTVKGRKRL